MGYSATKAGIDKALVNLVTLASVLMYAGAPFSLGASRRQVPDATRPYRIPGAAIMAPIGFVSANLLIYWTGLDLVERQGAMPDPPETGLRHRARAGATARARGESPRPVRP